MVEKAPYCVEFTSEEARLLARNHTPDFGNLAVGATLKLHTGEAQIKVPRIRLKEKVILSDKMVQQIVDLYQPELNNPDSTHQFENQDALKQLVDTCAVLLEDQHDLPQGQ